MPFWKPKKKKKAVHKAKPAKSLPKYEPKPFIPPEIPKIDISANQQKEPQKPAPKKASSSRSAILLPIRSEMVTLWRTTGLRPCTLAMFGILVELSVK